MSQDDRMKRYEALPPLWRCPDCGAWQTFAGRCHNNAAHEADERVIVEEFPAARLAGAVEAEREWCRQILDVDQRDAGDGRLLATLANMAATRLRELGGQ